MKLRISMGKKFKFSKKKWKDKDNTYFLKMRVIVNKIKNCKEKQYRKEFFNMNYSFQKYNIIRKFLFYLF